MSQYVVLFNEAAPKSKLEIGDTLRIVAVGDTDKVNEEFGPMAGNGGGLGIPIQQLERIRVIIDSQGDERELLPGDAIILGDWVYAYDAAPVAGGFYAPTGEVARCVLDSMATEES